jgi:hypothetical protein
MYIASAGHFNPHFSIMNICKMSGIDRHFTYQAAGQDIQQCHLCMLEYNHSRSLVMILCESSQSSSLRPRMLHAQTAINE